MFSCQISTWPGKVDNKGGNAFRATRKQPLGRASIRSIGYLLLGVKGLTAQGGPIGTGILPAEPHRTSTPHPAYPSPGGGAMIGPETPLLALLAGLVLLVAGRRLFWLFVGLVGFITVYRWFEPYSAAQP